MPTVYITHQNEMVDAICRRAYGDESGFVEMLLEANPGLSAMPVPLPAGTQIILPDIPLRQDSAQLVSLWD